MIRIGILGAAKIAPKAILQPAIRRSDCRVVAVAARDAGRAKAYAAEHGIQTGDVAGDKAVLWARADRPSRLMVEWSTTESFARSTKVMGPETLDADDYTARVTVGDLPVGQQVFWRASFVSLDDINAVSEPVVGRFRTQPVAGTDVSFVWSGDTAGQGWGINPDFGGMKIYEEMRKAGPDFFIHSGDTIYADGPIKAEVALKDGTVWKNLTLDGTHKVAETLDEYRANYRYNLMDENIRRMNLEVPTFFQWDDHETMNNWYPQEVLAASDERYQVKSAALLSASAAPPPSDRPSIRPPVCCMKRRRLRLTSVDAGAVAVNRFCMPIAALLGFDRLGRVVDRGADADVGRAAADIAVHRRIDVGIAGFVVLLQQ